MSEHEELEDYKHKLNMTVQTDLVSELQSVRMSVVRQQTTDVKISKAPTALFKRQMTNKMKE